MDAIEAILSRRSIRQYTSQPVPDEIVRELLTAAMSAPSAVNEQPWQFIVITDRHLLNGIPQITPYAQMAKDAALVVLVCGDTTREKYHGFWPQDCAAATENLLIAANARGLGAVWCGVYPVDERVQGLRRYLQLPDYIVPFSLVPIGYPAEKREPRHRYDGSRVHFNGW